MDINEYGCCYLENERQNCPRIHLDYETGGQCQGFVACQLSYLSHLLIHTTTRTYLVELLRKVLKLRVKCQLIYIRSISGGWH